MPVCIRNMQSVIRVNRRQLKKHAKMIVAHAGYQDYDVGLMMVHNEEMRQMNHLYRGKDEVTDVLAFPYHEILPENAGLLPEVHPKERILGDIVLGMPYIALDCLKRDEDLQTTVLSIFTHGLCHLVGFNHESEHEWMQMYREEVKILEKFNKFSGFHCKPLLGLGHYE
ncbi:hypothetical protein EGW08_017025 [Elysia chlorotica]|uniref:Uncharacterized protein n=1 Tax=Elysia chlorotica TaxID=188477 RepID=A0A433T0Z7_ELYCH|nr:hypothetical protein EGW08_017025 [Elysia chlorotica]